MGPDLDDLADDDSIPVPPIANLLHGSHFQPRQCQALHKFVKWNSYVHIVT
jgi:hypothetical protein